MKLIWDLCVSLLSMNLGPPREAEIRTLILRHAQGDHQAFAKLLDVLRPDLWSFLRNHVRERQDAEDLFQEICLKVYKNLASLKEPEKFRSWLFSIALNSVRSFFRKRQLVAVDEPVLQALDPRSEHSDQPEKALARTQELALLRKCLAQLPDRDREILLLEVMADLPQKDIADQMDLNLNTVKTILRRARIRLARMMVELERGI